MPPGAAQMSSVHAPRPAAPPIHVPAPPGPSLPLVRDVMTEGVVTCQSKDTCREAARLMREHDVGILPVMDGDRPVGMITDRDIVLRQVAESHSSAEKTRVSDCMTRRVISVTPSDTLTAALLSMKEHGIRRLLVVDGNVPRGILTLDDVLVHVGRARDVAQVVDEVLVQYSLRNWP